MNRSRAALPALALVLVVLATGCSGGAGGTGTKGFVGGDGSISIVDAGDRKTPGRVAGENLEGVAVDLADYRGKVVVINVWGSWCNPCRSEAKHLVAAANELQPKGVVFLGINTRDLSVEDAVAFERARKVPYASIYDPGGKTLLAFRGTLPPSAIPSTVVIDAEGRVAARVIGAITSTATLVGMVEDVQK